MLIQSGEILKTEESNRRTQKKDRREESKEDGDLDQKDRQN